MRNFILLFITAFGNASLSQGLIFDKEKFEKREPLIIERADTYPKSFSLKGYTPYVFAQQNATCVAYSLAVARTIAYAYNRRIGDIKDISARVFSPHWVYYRNKELGDNDCSRGLNIEVAIDDIIKNGIPRLASVEYKDYYPFTNTVLCNFYPHNIGYDYKEASMYKLDGAYRIKDSDGIKIALSKGMPVVVAMLIPKSFETAKGVYWHSNSTDNYKNAQPHAMVVVSYDDLGFEIMNSWGTNWGNNGFIKIMNQDFAKYTLGAYALEEKMRLGAMPESQIDSLYKQDLKLSKSINKDRKSEYPNFKSELEKRLKEK